ncbi:hypothetical protein L1987_12456 [Smallanthus sonchifolius]|uniref:Uncharacterized protein n=1 Tax=Smallanthus sonchifolius TaxID=185202 RepID=A0ACB9JG44_9ASTR|nr:hypothetical protein L1987_12456 [Smallanthus sonchifolius]
MICLMLMKMTVKKRRKKNRIWTALVDSGTKNCDGPKPISIVGSTTSIGTQVTNATRIAYGQKRLLWRRIKFPHVKSVNVCGGRTANNTMFSAIKKFSGRETQNEASRGEKGGGLDSYQPNKGIHHGSIHSNSRINQLLKSKVNLKDPNAHTIISRIEATQKIYRDFDTLDKKMKLEKKKLESVDKIMNKLRIAQMKAKEMRKRMSTNEGPRTSLKVIGRDCASLCNFGNLNAILGTW